MALYHLDCSSGIAGDMFLGACLDLGMPLEVVADAIASLGLRGVGVERRKASRGGFAGTRFRVLLEGRPLEGPDPEAEEEGEDGHGHAPGSAHPHGHAHEHRHDHARDSQPLDRVHFHEVGAVDSIVDLVGAAAAVEHLAPERLTCGPVNVGGGRVRTDHGELPVPAPATAELLQGVPIHGGPGGELTTPTGAVLVAELVDAFVELPPLVLEATGYGLGRRQLSMQPNALRLLRGRPLAAGDLLTGRLPDADAAPAGRPEVAVVECEIDDLTGEGFGFLMERLLAAGALDVYFTPVVMKKGRPGTLVTMLCRRPRLEELAATLLLESGSLGCRYHLAARFEAERDSVEVDTAFGGVRVKRSRLADRSLAMAPEYEDCRRLALAAGVTWREVYNAAVAALAIRPPS